MEIHTHEACQTGVSREGVPGVCEVARVQQVVDAANDCSHGEARTRFLSNRSSCLVHDLGDERIELVVLHDMARCDV